MDSELVATTDWHAVLVHVLPFVVIFLLIWRDGKGLRSRESEDVWTIRKTKKKE
jgi:hypothetical protein